MGEVNKENLREIRTQEPNYESDDVLFIDGYDTHKLNVHTVNFCRSTVNIDDISHKHTDDIYVSYSSLQNLMALE